MNLQNNDFLSSLGDMSPAQTGYSSAKQRKSAVSTDMIIRFVLILLCLAVFFYSAGTVISRLVADSREQNVYQSITDIQSALTPLMFSATPDNLLTLHDSINLVIDNNTVTGSQDTNYDDPARYARYRAALMSLKRTYPDMYAWIVVTGTNIDYPVVKGETNDTYIRTDYKGNPAQGGSIFVDYKMTEDYSLNLNGVFYGHNMTGGNMFRAIRNWFESANRNSTAETMRIEIYTEDALYVYTPFSAYRKDGNDFAKVSFSSKEEFVEYLDMIKSRSIIPCNLPYDSSSKIATLITCTNNYQNAKERYALHCLLTQVINFN